MTDQLQIALIGAGAAILGGIVGGLSGSLQLFRDWWLRPILSIDYQGTDANFVPSEYPQDGKLVSAIFVRARVRNIGVRVAHGCRVFLT
jgi:hypothetical protein